MKIMIFRTFAHTRIWEGIEPHCYYKNLSFNIINTWEPNIININLNEAVYGLGIYTSRYFTFENRYGKKAYNNTIEETQPSLLRLQPAPSNPDNCMEFQNGELKCYFELISKYDEIDKTKMAEIDEELVRLKKRIVGDRAQRGKYDSLYFSLEYSDVKNILGNHGLSIPFQDSRDSSNSQDSIAGTSNDDDFEW